MWCQCLMLNCRNGEVLNQAESLLGEKLAVTHYRGEFMLDPIYYIRRIIKSESPQEAIKSCIDLQGFLGFKAQWYTEQLLQLLT